MVNPWVVPLDTGATVTLGLFYDYDLIWMFHQKQLSFIWTGGPDYDLGWRDLKQHLMWE